MNTYAFTFTLTFTVTFTLQALEPLVTSMVVITKATLPRKRAVYICVTEDGDVAICISSAITGSDFRRKCEICGIKFKSNKQAYAQR
jgi:hypothetical protein